MFEFRWGLCRCIRAAPVSLSTPFPHPIQRRRWIVLGCALGPAMDHFIMVLDELGVHAKNGVSIQPNRTVIQLHVVVRAYADNVVTNIRSIVRSAQRSHVVRFSIWLTVTEVHYLTTNLTPVLC